MNRILINVNSKILIYLKHIKLVIFLIIFNMARGKRKGKDDATESKEDESVVTEKDPLSFEGSTLNGSKNKNARIAINENQLEDMDLNAEEQTYETSTTSLSSRQPFLSRTGDLSRQTSTVASLIDRSSTAASTATSLSRTSTNPSNDTSSRMTGNTLNTGLVSNGGSVRNGNPHNESGDDDTTVGEFDLVPYDGVHKLPSTYRQTTTDELMMVNAKSKKTYILLQLLRIVSGSTDPLSNKGSSNYSYYNRNQQNQSMKGSYSRMFLFREITSRIGQVVYMIESRISNEKLWGRQPEFRDNGVLTIGRCIAVICPTPIQNLLKDEVPILETRHPAVLMKHPKSFHEVSFNKTLVQNNTQAFVMNNVTLEVLNTVPETTKCAGLFCDRQRVREVIKLNKGCGCYGMNSRISNLTVAHSIIVKDNNDMNQFSVEDYSSLTFSRLYLTEGAFDATTRINDLQQLEVFDALEDAVDSVVQKINTNGGFTITGWYKRGQINDQSNKDEKDGAEKVESAEIGYHIVNIIPTTCKEDMYENKKFDLSKLK